MYLFHTQQQNKMSQRLAVLLCLTLGMTFAFPQTSSNKAQTSSCLQRHLNARKCVIEAEKDVPLDRVTCAELLESQSCYQDILTSCTGDFRDSKAVFEQRLNSSMNVLYPNNPCGYQESG